MTVKAKADAIDRFVRTLKSGGLYDDIGAACIMAGWTNLAGALYPLKGAAPTNNGFLAADLDAGIGLKGNGSNKWIGTNRLGTADNQNDVHQSAYMSASAPTVVGGSSRYIMGDTDSGNTNAILQLSGSLNDSFQSSPSGSVVITGTAATAGFRGMSRTSSTALAARSAGTANSGTVTSVPRSPNQVGVYGSAFGVASATGLTDATLSFYSIGSALDLAALDSAVSTLMADLRAIDEDGFDRDALAYIRAVEAADGSFLETGVKQAINSFIVGLKKDNLWNAIKASCILCGARTIAGALVPLAGTAPTAYGGWSSGDYNRETGLVGNGTTKYLDSNRANNADPQNDQHMAAYATAVTNGTAMGVGALQAGITRIGRRNPPGFTNTLVFRSQTNTGVTDKTDAQWTSGLAGVSRSQSNSYIARSAGTNLSVTADSQVPYAQNSYVFCRNSDGAADDFATSGLRLAFYSIGSAISDLSLLDARVTTLVSQIAAAIP